MRYSIATDGKIKAEKSNLAAALKRKDSNNQLEIRAYSVQRCQLKVKLEQLRGHVSKTEIGGASRRFWSINGKIPWDGNGRTSSPTAVDTSGRHLPQISFAPRRKLPPGKARRDYNCVLTLFESMVGKFHFMRKPNHL